MYFSSQLTSRPDPFHRRYVLSNTFIILQCNIRSAYAYKISSDNVCASDPNGGRLHTQSPLTSPLYLLPEACVCLCAIPPQSLVFVHDLPFSDCIESYALLIFFPFLPPPCEIAVFWALRNPKVQLKTWLPPLKIASLLSLSLSSSC